MSLGDTRFDVERLKSDFHHAWRRRMIDWAVPAHPYGIKLTLPKYLLTEHFSDMVTADNHVRLYYSVTTFYRSLDRCLGRYFLDSLTYWPQNPHTHIKLESLIRNISVHGTRPWLNKIWP